MATLGYNITTEQLASHFNVGQSTNEIFSDNVLNNKLNKWSKRKPIHYSQTSPLSDTQFRGMSTDHAKGIYYGLKAGVQNATAANIHAADWSYVSPPQGSIPSSPFRIDDFWGYEKDEKYPTLYGSGLSSGQEVIYTNNTDITTTLIRSNLTTIVDVAEVIGNSMDYSKLYLCVLVGNKARAMLNKDTGTVTPILYNGVEYNTFCFPDMSGIINTASLPMTTQVSIFLVGSDGIASLRESWVDMSLAINLGTKPITLPYQVNLSMTFKAAGKIYITAFDLVIATNLGTTSVTPTITVGEDWDEAYAYRIVYNVSQSGGQSGSTSIPVDKILDSSGKPLLLGKSLDDIMTEAGFVKNPLSTSTYSLSGDFQVQESSTGSWKSIGYKVTKSVVW